jgi:hypothetical protein
MFRSKAAREVLALQRLEGWAFDVEVLYLARRLGYSIVEVLSPCPTNWKMDPVTACKWVEEEMVKEYKPGLLTDKREEKRKEKG